jgi:hypothetical protein
MKRTTRSPILPGRGGSSRRPSIVVVSRQTTACIYVRTFLPWTRTSTAASSTHLHHPRSRLLYIDRIASLQCSAATDGSITVYAPAVGTQGRVFRDRRPACKRIAPGATPEIAFPSDGSCLGRQRLTWPIRPETAAPCIRQQRTCTRCRLSARVPTSDRSSTSVALTTREAMINVEFKRDINKRS